MLDGAKALALPTRFGQSLEVSNGTQPGIHWKSFLDDKSIWIDNFFSWETLKKLPENLVSPENQLQNILFHAFELTKKDFSESESLHIETYLNFPKDWGLGTSSTLINNIAEWLSISPYKLLELTFGGSGYDIAAASAKGSILYNLNNDGSSNVETVNFNPVFSDNIYFVHLNQKMNSRNAIADYSKLRESAKLQINHINKLTLQIVDCKTLSEFEFLITQHEEILSDILQVPTVKSRLFKDFPGAIKSLGAWGGDFVMVTSERHPREYFGVKGFLTVLNFTTMAM